tara:strand:+ start:3254 stop:3943 length:690 start_codon:yes stop_codon:yes gene_type:complete
LRRKVIIWIAFLVIVMPLSAQKILFLGNSLTYTNNLPEILEHIAEQYQININTESLCLPNYALIDHLDDGSFQKKIAKEKYDYVIVQQGPSSQQEGKTMLLRDGATIKALCSKYRAILGFFMVWPSKNYYFTFDKVIENHELAAKSNKALLFPVGSVWKEYNKEKNLESLYGSDRFHPSKAGIFLGALTIFHQLYPKKNLHQVNVSYYKKWIKDEDTFKAIIRFLEKQS